MIQINEVKGHKSWGSIDDYLSGREEYDLDRTNYPRNIAGSVGLEGFGDVVIHNTMPNRYLALLGKEGEQYKGKGSSPKAAFFNLLHNMRDAGLG